MSGASDTPPDAAPPARGGSGRTLARAASAGAPRAAQRHDGFTPERQRHFLEMLAATASVRDAAKAAGVSATTVYRHRYAPAADAFRMAWVAALAQGYDRLVDTAFERATTGVEEPVFWRGEAVGTRTRYNDRLLMFLLRRRSDFIPIEERFEQGTRMIEELYDAQSFNRMLDLVGPRVAEAAPAGPGDEARPHVFTSSLSASTVLPERPVPPPVDEG